MIDAKRARFGVSVVFAVCGAGFATWAARVPAAQARLGLSTGQLAVGLFGLAAGSVLALLAAGPVITTVGSRAGSLVGALLLCAGLPAIAFAPGTASFVAALALLGVGNSVLDVSMNAHAARTRRAHRASTLTAVVVRFSRTRKRYERQGLLVEPHAVDGQPATS